MRQLNAFEFLILLCVLFVATACTVEVPSDFYTTSTTNNPEGGAEGDDSGGDESTTEDTPEEGGGGEDTDGDESTEGSEGESSEGGEECSSIEDCITDDLSDCLQPSCLLGTCVFEPVDKGEACNTPEGLDGQCVQNAECNNTGECVPLYEEAGTPCVPDSGLPDNLNPCERFVCGNANGLCTLQNKPNGSPCGEPENPCDLRYCNNGSCEDTDQLCQDNKVCTGNWCVTTDCPNGSPSGTIALFNCNFTMQTGPFNNKKSYEWVKEVLDEDAEEGGGFSDEQMLVIRWCNEEYANQEGHDDGGCLPDATTSLEQFVANFSPERGIEKKCQNLPRNHACEDTDLNSCTATVCKPNDDQSHPATGCLDQPLPVNTPCSGDEFCFKQFGTCDADGNGMTCQAADGTDTGDVCAADPMAATSPCYNSVCNPQTGECDKTLTWEAGEEAPMCDTGGLLPPEQKTVVGNKCYVGKCTPCEAGNPNCNGAPATCELNNPWEYPCVNDEDCSFANQKKDLWICENGTCTVPCGINQNKCTTCIIETWNSKNGGQEFTCETFDTNQTITCPLVPSGTTTLTNMLAETFNDETITGGAALIFEVLQFSTLWDPAFVAELPEASSPAFFEEGNESLAEHLGKVIAVKQACPNPDRKCCITQAPVNPNPTDCESLGGVCIDAEATCTGGGVISTSEFFKLETGETDKLAQCARCAGEEIVLLANNTTTLDLAFSCFEECNPCAQLESSFSYEIDLYSPESIAFPVPVAGALCSHMGGKAQCVHYCDQPDQGAPDQTQYICGDPSCPNL